jgi:flavin-dependent dehydrogenase
MKNFYDVAIAGGGPAGSMAASELSRMGKTVVLFEAADFDQLRIGETVAPPIINLLKKQGLWEFFKADGHLPSWGNRSAWGSENIETTDYIFDPYGNGWHLDRRIFDKMLFEKAKKSGASCFTGQKVVQVKYQDHFELDIESTGNGPRAVSSQFFLDASGRIGHLSRNLGGRKVKDYPLFAHIVFYADNKHSDSGMLVESVPDGWWYSAPLPGNRLVLVFFTDAEGSRRLARIGWESFLDLAPNTRLVTQHLIKQGESKIYPAGSQLLSKTDWEVPWLACGDAQMAVDPLSGSGVQHAMENGIEAALAANAWLEGDISPAKRFEKKNRDAYESYLGLRAAYYAIEKRWPAAEFWQKQQEFILQRVPSEG